MRTMSSLTGCACMNASCQYSTMAAPAANTEFNGLRRSSSLLCKKILRGFRLSAILVLVCTMFSQAWGRLADNVYVQPTFSISPGLNRMTITWNKFPGAVSYNIYKWKRDVLGAYSHITVAKGVTATSYIVRGLSAKAEYSYYVSAVFSDGSEYPGWQSLSGTLGFASSEVSQYGTSSRAISGDMTIASGEKKRYRLLTTYKDKNGRMEGIVDDTDLYPWGVYYNKVLNANYGSFSQMAKNIPLPQYFVAGKVAKKTSVLIACDPNWRPESPTTTINLPYNAITKTITIYPAKVVFNLGKHGTRAGGGELEQYLDAGESAKEPTVKAASGWRFKNWDKGFSHVKGVVTVNAVYERIHTVTFKANGGSGTMAAQTFVHGVNQVLRANKFKCDGKTFWGWAQSAKGSVIYSNKQGISVSSDLTLYAKWKTKTYKVTYMPGINGCGSKQTDTKTHGKALTLKGVTFTRKGYTQVGWATSDGGTRAYKLSASYAEEAAMTLYPVWKANRYSVVFAANGGSVNPSSKDVTYDAQYGELPIPSRTGTRYTYAFDGWYTAASGGAKITSYSIVTNTTTLILYAHWTRNTRSLLYSRLIASNDQDGILLPTSPRKDFSLNRLRTTQTGGEQWTPEMFAVTVLKVGAGTVKGAGSKPYSSKVTLTATAAKGSVFLGWYKIVNSEEGIVNSEVLVSQKTSYSFTMPANAVTLTAKFVTKAEDQAGIGMEFGGVGVGGALGERALPAMINVCGVVTEWPVAASGLTPVSVSVSGLPKGMEYDAKKKAITGVPSAANTSGTMKITVKSAGASRTWSVKWRTVALPSFARGTFNGWTYGQMENGEWKMENAVRKVTVTVSTAGKITAKVGALTLAQTGWTVGDDGFYRATLSATRTVGTGTKATKYKDVMTLVLDPVAEWTEDQLTGTVRSYLTTDLDTPLNADAVVSARRNPFGDNAEAKDVAAQLYAMGAQAFTDAEGLVWNVKVAANGVATISRTTGTGKNKKTVSATAVVEVMRAEGEGYQAVARFLVSGKAIEVPWP